MPAIEFPSRPGEDPNSDEWRKLSDQVQEALGGLGKAAGSSSVEAPQRAEGPSLRDIDRAHQRVVRGEIARAADALAQAAAEAEQPHRATMTPIDEAMWAELDQLTGRENS